MSGRDEIVGRDFDIGGNGYEDNVGAEYGGDYATGAEPFDVGAEGYDYVGAPAGAMQRVPQGYGPPPSYPRQQGYPRPQGPMYARPQGPMYAPQAPPQRF